MLHSKALPHFLAPLASAVALAGQDISLMRRVRALVTNSSGQSLGSAIRSASMRYVMLRAVGVEVGSEGKGAS